MEPPSTGVCWRAVRTPAMEQGACRQIIRAVRTSSVGPCVARKKRMRVTAVLVLTLSTIACSERPLANTLVEDVCRIDGSIAPLPPLPEASGVTPSARIPDRFWTHNDSGRPILFNIDKSGAVRGRVELAGTRVTDWEAVASGPCPSGSCLYVADIGDNN